jgi:hypothetical protein
MISRVFIASFFVFGSILFIFYGKRYSKIQDKKLLFPQVATFFLFFLFASCIFLQFVIVISTEWEYSNLEKSYSQQYILLIDDGYNEVDATWNITNSYYGTYKGQYSNESAVIPSRQILLRGLNPVFMVYFCYFDGFPKLNTIQNCGNCGEFAVSTSVLLKDITGYDTRIIHAEGIDHSIPEININNEWWVFDRIYTIELDPVKECNYALFLQQNNQGTFKFIHDLKEDSEMKSVLSSHGFDSSNLTITALKNTQSDKSLNNSPIEGANVEVFILDSNSSDPLVGQGVTDENGNCSLTLKNYDEYVVRVKVRYLNHKLVGIKEIYLSSNTTNIVVDLKYEEGMNRSMPGINLNCIWWGLRSICITDFQPPDEFNNSLFPIINDLEAFNQMSSLNENHEDEHGFIEKGFDSSSLTITAKKNVLLSKTWDDELISGATVEIYKLNDSSVPFVGKGMTDKLGNFSAILENNRRYLIIVKSSKHKLVGTKETFLTSNPANIVVDLKCEK